MLQVYSKSNVHQYYMFDWFLIVCKQYVPKNMQSELIDETIPTISASQHSRSQYNMHLLEQYLLNGGRQAG
jgi:hypothetical protein